MVNVALLAPAAAGLKFTNTVQELLAATLPPAAQLPPPTIANSAGFVPPSVNAEMFSGAVPVLLRVSVWVPLVLPTVVAAKFNTVLETAAMGLAPPVPVPLKAMAIGVKVLLWLMLSVPLRVPAVVGVNATKIVQLEPTLTAVPQVPPVRAKSPSACTARPLMV